MTRLSDAAHDLAAAGWRVFPVDAVTKRPRTPNGHHAATTEFDRIESWGYSFDHGGAIATPTGDGLCVIDIDPRNGGELPAWVPATRTVVTQSGGLHLHYRIDEDVPSRASVLGPGVDIKCTGGYVLIPPSPGYAWSNVPNASWDHLRAPEAMLSRAELEARYVGGPGSPHGARRVPPSEWRRGMIHDQVVAWAAWFAGPGAMDEAEVHDAVWHLVTAARVAGCTIDNRGGHIEGAVDWVLAREQSKEPLA